MTSNKTERQKPNEHSSETHIKKFWAALSRYRAAQASIFAVQANDGSSGEVSDESMGNAIDALHEATCDVLNAPIGAAHQLLPKFELIEELMMKEVTIGPSSANYPVLAMASLKRDLLGLEGQTLTL